MHQFTRIATEADVPSITRLYASLTTETAPGSFGDLHRVDDWSFNDAFVADLICHPSRGIVAVAIVDDLIVGVAIAYHQHQPDNMPCVRPRKTLYLEAMHVEQRLRRRGIATDLLHAVEAYAIRNGYDDMELDTYVSNAPAERTYESAGFVPVKRKWRKAVCR